jgi:hypothetical protein
VTRYLHLQRAWWTMAILFPVGGVFVAAAVFGASLPAVARLAMAGVAALMAWVLITFSRLTVEVSNEVNIYFGWGWPRKTFEPAQIDDVRTVRNPLWYGFGIRWIPKGWMWNVSGLDAVELTLRTGRVFRIGTDDPDGLLAAIRWVLGRA